MHLGLGQDQHAAFCQYVLVHDVAGHAVAALIALTASQTAASCFCSRGCKLPSLVTLTQVQSCILAVHPRMNAYRIPFVFTSTCMGPRPDVAAAS